VVPWRTLSGEKARHQAMKGCAPGEDASGASAPVAGTGRCGGRRDGRLGLGLRLASAVEADDGFVHFQKRRLSRAIGFSDGAEFVSSINRVSMRSPRRGFATVTVAPKVFGTVPVTENTVTAPINPVKT
jgi:hypothetical protein